MSWPKLPRLRVGEASSLTADLGVGLGGGMLAVIFVQALGVGIEAGWFAMTLVSLVGAS
jgi:hypothetical protein